MIFLNSTTDVIQIVTSGSCTLRCHISWVDKTSSAVTPGRYNTVVSSNTTQTIIPAPAANTYRSIKYISIFNEYYPFSGYIGTVDVTIRYNDATYNTNIWHGTLSYRESIIYNENNFTKVSANGIPYLGSNNLILTSGYQYDSNTVPRARDILECAGAFSTTLTYTWTKPTTFKPSFVLVKLWGGGGGGGGGSSLSTAVASHGGAGGGGGAFTSYIFLADDLPDTATIYVGGGGTWGSGGGDGTAGTAGGYGSDTSFVAGSNITLTAYGGGGGAGGDITATATAGGSGGGLASAGTNGTTVAASGGAPIYNAAANTAGTAMGGQGGYATITATATLGTALGAVYGGAAGAGQPATAAGGSFGGSSLYGGGGGGHGGCHTAVPATTVAGDGGRSGTTLAGGGGLAGISGVGPGPGTSGLDGFGKFLSNRGGGGGGGGGSTITPGQIAGSGGWGGSHGGGGGGGGAAANPGTGGMGGYGGVGWAVIYTW